MSLASPTRRHSPQPSPSTVETDAWRTEMQSVSPISDDFGAMSAPYMDDFMYTPDSFDNDPLYNIDARFLHVDSGYHVQRTNALGLFDSGIPPSPPMHSDATLDPLPHGSSPYRALPQIKTVDLSCNDYTYMQSPHAHSPYHISSQPPLSATTSTPSSAGHYSIPMTPSSLPPVSHNFIPSLHTSLLSPHTPYSSHCLPMPSPQSPATALFAPSPSVNHTSPLSSVQTVLELASRFPDWQSILVQRIYRPNTQSDRRRYVEEVSLEPPIMFYALSGEACGIRCTDALSSRFSGLYGRDDPMFEHRGPSVSIRLMWPGYAPWSRQIPTRDFRSPPQPITRSKLAKNVAKTIKRFIEDMGDKPMEEDADVRYKVGPQHIRIEDIELVGLQHVSMGSWQAHVRLRRRT